MLPAALWGSSECRWRRRALVHEQAERRPEEAFQQIWKPGVLGFTHKVPFGEFAGRVDRTAAALRARGLGRERAADLQRLTFGLGQCNHC